MSHEGRYVLVILDNTEVNISLHRDLDRLLGELEPPEVMDGAYEVFDNAGRRAHLRAETQGRWDVTVESWEDVGIHYLRDRISCQFGDADLGDDWRGVSLPELLDRLETALKQLES